MFRGGKARRHLTGTPVRLFWYVTPTMSMRPACSLSLLLRPAPRSKLSQEGAKLGLQRAWGGSNVVHSLTPFFCFDVFHKPAEGRIVGGIKRLRAEG